MELLILGSGTAAVSCRRASAGYLLRTEKTTILIDSGAGTLRRIAEEGVDINEIGALFYTHIHPDHVADLVPFLFASKYGCNLRTQHLSIYGGKGFKRFFEKQLDVYQHWLLPEKYDLQVTEILGGIEEFSEFTIHAQHVKHTPESLAYSFEKGSKRIAFSGDTDLCDGVIDIAKNVNIFVVECSFPNSQKQKGHLSPKEVSYIANKAKPDKLVLSHMYPPCDSINIKEELEYQGDVIVAEDGMSIKI